MFSQHLDEFFAVRVSGLMGQDASGLTVHSLDGRTPQQTLSEIRERVLAMTAEQSELWRQELLPALARKGSASAGSPTAPRRSSKSLPHASSGRSIRC